MTIITGTLLEDQHTFLIISRSVLFTMRNVSDRNSRENQNTRFMFNNFFFFENRPVYEIMWKYSVERMAIWRMRIARWIPKATNIHLAYVILIAFPLQQWLHQLCTYSVLQQATEAEDNGPLTADARVQS
jgi:hypothetical protein